MSINNHAVTRGEDTPMDAGLFVNLFKVNFEDRDTSFMQAERSRYPELRALRERLAEQEIAARVYATGGSIYGYGEEAARLQEFGFTHSVLHVGTIPSLASQQILEGYLDSLKQVDYAVEQGLGHATAYQLGKALLQTASGVKLFRGVELQTLFLLDPETETLVFLMAVDPVFAYKDPRGQPINTHEIVSQFGSETLRDLRIRQGDLAPRGGINLEVARQRLADMILPFVAARHSFCLPCGIPAELGQEPVRIILAGPEMRS